MLIEKHETISRLVTNEDIPKVLEEADKIVPLLNKPIGIYRNFFAIAHPQIEKDRPMRFFVVNANAPEFFGYRSVVIINPVILKHTNSTIDSQEGCATFAKLPMVTVQRWNKCEVEFSPLVFDKNRQPAMGERIKLSLSGKVARIWEHEIDHLNGIYIY